MRKVLAVLALAMGTVGAGVAPAHASAAAGEQDYVRCTPYTPHTNPPTLTYYGAYCQVDSGGTVVAGISPGVYADANDPGVAVGASECTWMYLDQDRYCVDTLLRVSADWAAYGTYVCYGYRSKPGQYDCPVWL